MEIFLYEHLSPGNWDEKFFDKIALLLQQWPKWHNFCLVGISTIGVGELALLVKLQESTKLRQPRMIQVYVPPFGFVF